MESLRRMVRGAGRIMIKGKEPCPFNTEQIMKREWIDRPENWVEAHGMRMAAHTQQSYMHGKNTKNGRR